MFSVMTDFRKVCLLSISCSLEVSVINNITYNQHSKKHFMHFSEVAKIISQFSNLFCIENLQSASVFVNILYINKYFNM